MIVKDFLDELEKDFPEKLIQLYTINYTDKYLIDYLDYLENNSIDSSKFIVNDFKNYVDRFNFTVNLQSVQAGARKLKSAYTIELQNDLDNSNIGDIVFDNSEMRLKVFNGTEWITYSN